MNDYLVEVWRKIIQGDSKSWVLFEHATCVILMQPQADLTAQANALLAEWGPVQVATQSADFNVVKLENDPGWVVTCHHPDILTYVPANEDDSPESSEIMIGLVGRSARAQDAEELNVIHVEGKRSQESRYMGQE